MNDKVKCQKVIKRTRAKQAMLAKKNVIRIPSEVKKAGNQPTTQADSAKIATLKADSFHSHDIMVL